MSSKPSFQLFPAIDVRGGRVVRLAQGDYDRETTYGDDPLAAAQAYAAQGANWLHLVDLDAARAGGYTLAPLLQQLRATTGLQVQTGGGVRSRDDVVALLEAGASRVVVGSLSVRAPEQVLGWLAEFGAERITVALDARQDEAGIWQLPIHGWTEGSGVALDALASRYAQAGMTHLLCTDIARDGMLTGPNFALYRHLVALLPQVQVQASGGVHAVTDVSAAKTAGCGGIVLGRALLEGRFTLEQAFAEAASC
ncbi:1-(5-phosphoribosyl)-5-[(5-phosphoribosylamino)methylideneamino]imidazole-4-carboxamide isomerase [Pseudoxanthomonas sp. JBR18]|uniref:1-(5-phosphoribosyl)-5-[(5- phosphoribosylamino)methylideneamino]imidazole-4- carboxamide isomerase n=1 Tax=Pseudoxanthomonas sp. JBR18 TaxID=2969308 RepID=UPI002305989C|nr:1-(5-phosphoribosyl)-5-[(5-phosphoribosylamino)methylideneamino]imidazole-4-carboxamide isomerase [Pseudoxanthomonas sp. JBR18]WCE03458.1 1-(5-phosphoribosyl)-5-[(5-phosphoribosylamino)methylideneamino]imidazole-4-carboxamide isomerase [Pseudoxanthomonas sp. JBR18]